MILQLSNYHYETAISDHELNLAFWRALRRQHGPLHVVGRASVSKVETTEAEGIVFTAFPRTGGNLGYMKMLSLWLRGIPKPRLLWCSDPIVTPLVAESFARRLQIPLLVELQGDFSGSAHDRSLKHWLGRRLALRAARRADFVRVCAHAHARFLGRSRIAKDRVYVIPTRVDISLFDPRRHNRASARKKLGLPSDIGVVIVGVGNLIPGKGFKHAIEALSILPADTRLVLVGDGPCRAELMEQAERLGVREQLFLPGKMPHAEIPQVLAAADIFVLPSYSEGMPRAVNEAQAMCVPVVASAIDGIAEQVLNDGSGILCPPGNSSALAEALMRLAQNPELRSEFGSRGRDHVSKSFSFECVMERWNQLLVRCMSGIS